MKVKRGKKHLPSKFQNSFFKVILSNNLVIIFTYWVFQGILYMNYAEKSYKLLITIFYTFLFMTWFSPLLAFFIAHSVNMFSNGHLIAMLAHMGVFDIPPKRFMEKTDQLRNRVMAKKFFAAVAAYGSLSRGVYKKTSDIDVRFIPKPGVKYWVLSLVYARYERFMSIWNLYPLDLYVFSEKDIQKKIRQDETPIVLMKTKEFVHPWQSHINYTAFKNQFISRNI